MSDWTQPICQSCWQRDNPGRRPIRMREPEMERCCLCAAVTTDGIYVRMDPAEVPFPDIRGDYRAE